MPERNPPSWLQGGSHPAENDRNAVAAQVLTSGVVEPGDLLVSAPGGVMRVSVAAGAMFLVGSRAYQGVYHAFNDGPVSLTIAAADPTNSRFDRVVAEVQDAFYAGSANAFRLSVVQGTAAASPVEPAIPADSIELARVTVPAAATSISAGNVLDRRVRVGWRGRVYRATTAASTPLVVALAASPTANALEVQSSTGTVLAAVTPSGGLTVSGGQTVKALSANTPGIIVRGEVSQAANLQEWQNNAGTTLAIVNNLGTIYNSGALLYGSQADTDSNRTQVLVTSTNAGNRAITARGAVSQTANLQEWQNNAGGVLANVTSAGSFATAGTVTAGPVANDGSVQVLATAASSTQRPLVVRGAAGQTSSLAEFQSSAGSALVSVNGAGTLQLTPTTVSGTAALDIGSGTQHFYLRPRSGGGIEFVNSASTAAVAAILDSGQAAFFLGGAVRLLDVGAADSAGIGFRTVRVPN